MKENQPEQRTSGAQPTESQKVVRGRPAHAAAGGSSGYVDAATNGKKKKKMTWKGRLLIITASVLCAVLLFIVGVYIFFVSRLNLSHIDIEQLSINSELDQIYTGQDITNIALFGIDTRSADSMEGLSDAVMILSVDRNTNELKLTSILRDSEVSIDGYGDEKINHAYSYGGAELAVKTINQNFQMNIQYYATVNFAGFAEIIDIMDGVEIEITDAERQQINKYSSDGGMKGEYLDESGLVNLTGSQAVAYSRIRKIGGDDARAERQRIVLECLLEKAKEISATKYPALLTKVLDNMETNMDSGTILAFAPMLLNDIKLITNSVPREEDNPISGNIGKGNLWVWRYDLDAASERLHQFIYGDADDTAEVLEDEESKDAA